MPHDLVATVAVLFGGPTPSSLVSSWTREGARVRLGAAAQVLEGPALCQERPTQRAHGSTDHGWCEGIDSA